MKKAVLLMISLILTGCTHQNISGNKSFAENCNTASSICKRNYSVLVEEIEKFNAAGGAFILVNLKNNEVLNSASISILENFDYNQDYSYTPNNVKKLLKKERLATPQQFIQDYVTFIKSATKEDLKKLRDNVTNGTARRINIEGINVYGLTATDYIIKRRNDISSLYREVFGYSETDEETGKETYIEGLKDELKVSYDEIKNKLKNTDNELIKLKNTKEEQYKTFINDWKIQYENTKKDIESLLPGALTAGLSSAYATKKRVERQESTEYAKTFRNAIIGLVSISSIPIICSILLMIFKNLTLDEIISKLPTMSLALLPLYAPVLWVAYSADKKLKLSKRLIEEYTHKEVVSKTYYGLSKQLLNVKEKDKSNELRDKLLYNLIAVNSENPGKLITDYENSNNPIMDFISNSAKFAKNLDKVSKSIERVKKTVSSSNENKDIPTVYISKTAD